MLYPIELWVQSWYFIAEGCGGVNSFSSGAGVEVVNVNPYSAPEMSSDAVGRAAAGADAVLPTMAKALAIIAICLGSFNILGGFCGVVGMSTMAVFFNSTTFQQQMEQDDSREAAEFRREMAQLQSSLPVFVVQLVLTMLVSIVLVIGGIGALKQKEWGRQLLVYSCIAYVLITLATWVYSIFSTLSSVQGMDGAQKAATVGGMIIGMVFGLVFLAYYIIAATYFSTASTRRFFTRST
jgi:hypothetical protein